MLTRRNKIELSTTGSVYKPIINKIMYLRMSIVDCPPGISLVNFEFVIKTNLINVLHDEVPESPRIKSTNKTTKTIIDSIPIIVETPYTYDTAF